MLEFFQNVINGELDVYVITFTLLAVMVVLLFLSFPMVVPLTVATMIGFLHFSDLPFENIIQQMITGITPVMKKARNTPFIVARENPWKIRKRL